MTASPATTSASSASRSSTAPTQLGFATRSPPYTHALTVPEDTPCAEHTLTAVVEDSLGQTARHRSR